MTQEAMDPLDVNWWWETFYNIDFCFVHLNPPLGHKVSKDDAPLKRCGSVIKPERHPAISIGSV